MPFPFNRLPWGEQYRLRDLMTPSELYQMQVALGRTLNSLGPPQPCRRVTDVCRLFQYEPNSTKSDAWIDSRNDQNMSVMMYFMRYDEHDGNEVIIIESLWIRAEYFKPDLEFPYFNHPYAVVTIKEVEIEVEKIDASALKKVASLGLKECHTLKYWLMHIEADVRMPLIFTLFPNLKNLQLEMPGFYTLTWLDDLVELKITGLEYIRAALDTYSDDEIFSVLKVESIYKLCKEQPPNFQLHFSFCTGNGFVDSSIWNFVNPYFRQIQDENDVTKLIIEIDRVDSVHQYHFSYA